MFMFAADAAKLVDAKFWRGEQKPEVRSPKPEARSQMLEGSSASRSGHDLPEMAWTAISHRGAGLAGVLGPRQCPRPSYTDLHVAVEAGIMIRECDDTIHPRASRITHRAAQRISFTLILHAANALPYACLPEVPARSALATLLFALCVNHPVISWPGRRSTDLGQVSIGIIAPRSYCISVLHSATEPPHSASPAAPAPAPAPESNITQSHLSHLVSLLAQKPKNQKQTAARHTPPNLPAAAHAQRPQKQIPSALC